MGGTKGKARWTKTGGQAGVRSQAGLQDTKIMKECGAETATGGVLHKPTPNTQEHRALSHKQPINVNLPTSRLMLAGRILVHILLESYFPAPTRKPKRPSKVSRS